MAITAKEVNELRKRTGAGMMDCKKALQEADGDMNAAIDYLRKKGQKVSEKRADREANEGVVVAKTDSTNTYGVVVKVTSETDFVAKNEAFIAFAQRVADLALDTKAESADKLKEANLDGKPLSVALDEQVGKIGEKIDVGQFEILEAPTVVAYNHANNRIGVLVGLTEGNDGKLIDTGKDVAMQIAAMNPLGLDSDDVPQDVQEREMEIARDQVRAEGKPENMVDQIAKGKLNKYFKENTLMNQPFVKNNKQTVKQYLEDTQAGLTVTSFKRIELGA